MEFNLNLSKQKHPIISHKDIQLTSHAIERANQRLNITKKDEIKKLAWLARKKGINFTFIRDDTYEKIGLTAEEYTFLKQRITYRNNSTSIYIYNGFVFIFVGKGKRILKTIINLKEIKAT